MTSKSDRLPPWEDPITLDHVTALHIAVRADLVGLPLDLQWSGLHLSLTSP